MKLFRTISILIILSSLLFSACQAQPVQSDKPLVFVSIPPQRYFVERIVGDSVDIQVMVAPGAEPHTYEPKPAQMTALAGADLYFSIGDSFEDTWLARIADSNPDLVIVDTAAGITKRHLDEHDGEDHEEDGGLDPHIWLSPRLVIAQAQHMLDALVALDPGMESTYTANLNAFIADINAMDEKFTTRFEHVSRRSFMVYHPSWGYFADDYGLEQIAVEIGGTEPSPSELVSIIEQAKTNDIHIIFAQPEFSSRFAESIAEQIDGQVLLISPLEENWMANMETMGQALMDGLSGE